ncbi:oxygenase [Pseudomonas sp. LB3P14]
MNAVLEDNGNASSDSKILLRDWVPGEYVLRDAWFPVALSRHVTDKPIRRHIHSLPYYLWRNRGRLEVLEFHPRDFSHLSSFAGEFTAGTGRFPALERYGYVWAWYGNPANANEALVPNVPFLPREGGLPGWFSGTVRFDCCSDLSLENLIDLTHADFLHGNVVGNEVSESDEVTVESTSETVTMIRTVRNKTAAPIMRLFGGIREKVQDVRAVIHVHLRSRVALAYGRYRPGFDIPLFHPCVPVARNRCRLDFSFNLVEAPWVFRQIMPQSSYLISLQDNLMTRPQNPRYAEPTERRDLHSRFDSPGMRYRFLMQQLARRQAQGDFSYLPDGDPSRDVSELLGMR